LEISLLWKNKVYFLSRDEHHSGKMKSKSIQILNLFWLLIKRKLIMIWIFYTIRQIGSWQKHYWKLKTKSKQPMHSIIFWKFNNDVLIFQKDNKVLPVYGYLTHFCLTAFGHTYKLIFPDINRKKRQTNCALCTV
jgi:hypothetical protein